MNESQFDVCALAYGTHTNDIVYTQCGCVPLPLPLPTSRFALYILIHEGAGRRKRLNVLSSTPTVETIRKQITNPLIKALFSSNNKWLMTCVHHSFNVLYISAPRLPFDFRLELFYIMIMLLYHFICPSASTFDANSTGIADVTNVVAIQQSQKTFNCWPDCRTNANSENWLLILNTKIIYWIFDDNINSFGTYSQFLFVLFHFTAGSREFSPGSGSLLKTLSHFPKW